MMSSSSSSSSSSLHFRLLPLLVLFGTLSIQNVVSLAGNDPSGSASPEDDFVVAAYLPEYRFYINTNRTAPHLTDLILFSLSPDDAGNLGPCCLEPHHFNQAREARAYKRQEFPDEQPLKLWLSLGGAGRSNSFAKVVANKSLRKKFLRNIREKIQKEQLDGVDFDWEAPQTHQQYQNYMYLIQDAHEELTVKAAILMSVALHPRQVFHHVFYNHVNRINLMTYDMIDQRTPGQQHHASMEQMKAAIQLLTKSKCSKSQIVIGIPAYARHGQNPGLVKTYSEIVDTITDQQPNANQMDVSARSSNHDGYLCDSPSLVRQKIDFAIKSGYKGIFFWELGQDKQHDDWAPGGMLLEAAANQVLRQQTKESAAAEL